MSTATATPPLVYSGLTWATVSIMSALDRLGITTGSDEFIALVVQGGANGTFTFSCSNETAASQVSGQGTPKAVGTFYADYMPDDFKVVVQIDGHRHNTTIHKETGVFTDHSPRPE